MPVNLPPKKYRPVYVRYVSSRYCRFNPSYANAPGGREEKDLWAMWEKRHPRRSIPDDELSLKPRKRKKVR